MSDRRDDILDTLTESKRLVGDLEMPTGEEYSINSILTEFGQDAAEPAPEEETAQESVEETGPSSRSAAASRRAKVLQFPKLFNRSEEAAEGEETEETPAEEPEEAAAPQPEESRPVRRVKSPSAWVEPTPEEERRLSLEDVMAHTVDSVMEDEDDDVLEERIPLGEQIGYVLANIGEKLSGLRRRVSSGKPEEPGRRAEPPEPDTKDAVREERRLCKRRKRQLIFSAPPLAALLAVTVIDTWWPDILPALWQELAMLRCGVAGGLLLLTCLAAPDVWRRAIESLKAHRVYGETAAAVAVLAVLGECIQGAVTGQMAYLPLAAPAALLVWLCLLGAFLESRGRWDSYRLLDLDDCPPYGVAVTKAGACKQKGRQEGFYNRSRRSDLAAASQTILLPLLLSGCTVLAGVVCIGGERPEDFLHVWSALLTASLPLGLPLCGTLPVSCLSRRLNRSGCAVAGYAGARALGGVRRMVVTDGDVFPINAVVYEDLKLNKEEITKVVPYAATVAKASASPLQPLFDRMLADQGGTYCECTDLRYYEDGGVSVTIHGENVKMGSAYFMKKSRIPLLRDSNAKMKTGVFLAVDGELAAVFVLKYKAIGNVDWALRALRRSRIVPVLAVRDSNVTPGLIKSIFRVDTKPIYPDVPTRLSLSEQSGETVPEANAAIYREGLMPFAETVVGSRRCCRMVLWSTVLCWLGSLCGLLLSYYLTSVAAYGALSAGYVLVFALLWLLPTVLLGDLTRRY